MRSARVTVSPALLLALLAAPVAGQERSHPRVDPASYQQTSADIPMRDGVNLHVEIFRPPAGADSLPILFTRTPYGVGESREYLTAAYQYLAEEGYIFVFQDIRGRYRSGERS